jgi:hypothetical protein
VDDPILLLHRQTTAGSDDTRDSFEPIRRLAACTRHVPSRKAAYAPHAHTKPSLLSSEEALLRLLEHDLGPVHRSSDMTSSSS